MSGCSDGVCILNKIESDFKITFDLERQVYSSAWGRGNIRQLWDLADGSHGMIVSSPPAAAELRFTSDWKQATIFSSNGEIGNGNTKTYSCKVIK